jgi:hypothetical protein
MSFYQNFTYPVDKRHNFCFLLATLAMDGNAL